MDDSRPPRELPRWKSHKEVWAEKITGVRTPEEVDGVILHLRGDFQIRVGLEWVGRHTPESGALTDLVGGYFVRYADGYESWSPAKAFEEGYTLIGDVQAQGSGAAPPEGA